MGRAKSVELFADETAPEHVDLDRYSVDYAAASLFSLAVARRCRAVPLGRRFGAPLIAVSDPNDLVRVDDLRAIIGRDFVTVVAPGEQIDRFIERLYLSSADADGDSDPLDDDALPSLAGASTFVDLLGPGTDSKLDRQAVPPGPLECTDAGGIFEPTELAEPEPTRVAEPEPDELADLAQLKNLDDLTGKHELADQEGRVDLAELPEPELPADLADQTEIDELTGFAPLNPIQESSDSEGANPQTDLVEPRGGLLDDAPASEVVGSPTFEPAPGPADSAPGPHESKESGTQLFDDSESVPEVDERLRASADHGFDEEDLVGFPPLARALVEGGRVSLLAMREVVAEHDRTGQPVARILSGRDLATEADLMWGMAQEMGLEFVDLDVYGVDYVFATRLPESTARHHGLLVIGDREGTPIVATSNPTNVFAMDDVRTILGRNFIMKVATRTQIGDFINRAYHQGSNVSEMASTAAAVTEGPDQTDNDITNIQAVVDDAPIVRYVNLLILQALNERASDIHVEPTEENLRIRYRIDGVLHDFSTAPRSIAGPVTTRLKVMADINIAEHRMPQDGRISLTVGKRPIDLRIATLPTIYGEKIVMRIIDKSNVVLGFEDLGFDEDLLERYRAVFSKPYGTILVTGPTGSGKTTTLYATLSALNDPERNIITVEDPVELKIKGINQVQLNTKAGLTFASALRSILRSDPDIVLVGEIRDRDTAMISVEAALTGHLVLATLHTNDAASTPMRLVEMGVEPYLVTAALSGALAQRLARRLCTHCREPYTPTEAEIVSAGWSPEEVYAASPEPKLYRPVGCTACSKTGYRGRKALLELMTVTSEVEQLILEEARGETIHGMAVEQGMVTLRQSGLRKALEGETTLEEVLRVVA